MDPDTCYDTMTAAYADGDVTSAAKHAADLCQWIARGGLAPDRGENWTATVAAILSARTEQTHR